MNDNQFYENKDEVKLGIMDILAFIIAAMSIVVPFTLFVFLSFGLIYLVLILII